MKKSFLVIGMGRFGVFIADNLLSRGNDVMIVDRDEARIEDIAPKFTNAYIGDCTNPEVIKALGVDTFDVVFMCIDEVFQAALEITCLLAENNAKYIVAQCRSPLQEKFLIRTGANEVVYPEKDIAEKLAEKHSMNNIFDYIKLSPEYSICEIPVPKEWRGKTLTDLNLRVRFQLNVLCLINNSVIAPMPSPTYVFNGEEHVMVLGKTETIKKITNKI